MTKKDNTPEQKIPWYRRRWFWGAGLGVVFVLACLISMDIAAGINPNSRPQSLILPLLLQFPIGLFMIGGINGVTIFYDYFYKFLYLYLAIYYISLLILLFKTFCKQKIEKIRYPLILIAIISISLFGFIILNGVG